MSVQLEVRLVGDDPEQQKAFDRASSDAQTQSAHESAFSAALDDAEKSASNAANRAAFAEALDDVLGTKKPDTNQSADTSKPEEQAIDSIDQLIKKIDELISSDRVQRGPRKEQADKEPQSEITKFFGSLDEAINKKLSDFGMEGTRAGRVVSGLSGTVKRYGTRLGNSKVGKSIAGALGRGGAAVAGTEAAGAAGGAAAAGGMAGVAASVALPLTAVAVGAAAAALTLKELTDAVQSAANELTDLSPELAGVRSQYQLQRELSRLDRADRIGAGAAQLEAARSRIDESMYEVQTKILEVILKFGPLLEAMLDGINVAVRAIDATIVAPANVAAAVTTPGFGDDIKALQDQVKATQALAQAVGELVTNNTDPQGAIDPFLSEILTTPGNPPRIPRFPKAGGRP